MMYDIAIVGAGLVGLATAYQIQQQKPDLRITILEEENRVAAHQSGHNSGVIHSGIYYPPGKTRAIHCRRGYDLLIQFCDQYDVPYELCGKLIVATTEAERSRLPDILSRGTQNGLTNLRLLEPAFYRSIEPHAGGIAAIHVPQAGIVDFPAMAEKMKTLLIANGATIQFNTKVTGIDRRAEGIVLKTSQDQVPCRFLINCAGLYSDQLADLSGLGRADIRILPFRGEYYKLKPEREHLVKGLIYPVPNPAFPFLGVHFTKMIRGGIEAGPNAVLAFAKEGYNNKTIRPSELWASLRFPGFHQLAKKHWRFGLQELKRSYNKRAFWQAIRPLVPDIQMNDLVPGPAGVRAMACDRNGNMLDDFLFWEGKGVLNVANAPSPAATACLAIGETVCERVLARISR